MEAGGMTWRRVLAFFTLAGVIAGVVGLVALLVIGPLIA
jgi:hypothetical protein